LISCAEDKVVSFSVNPAEKSILEDEYKLSSSDFWFVGEAHNMGLDFIFYNYVNNINELPTVTEYEQTIIELSVQYVNDNYPTSPISSDILITEDILKSYKNTESLVNEIETYLTQNQLMVFSQIKNVFF